jgi:hypothetical protein
MNKSYDTPKKYPEPQPTGKQYPDDWLPALRGRCEKCGYETRGVTDRWLNLCPYHWQKL